MAQHQIVLDGKVYSFSGPLKFKLLRIVEPAIARIDKMRRDFHATQEPFNEKFYDEVSTVIVTVLNTVDDKFTRETLAEMPVRPEDLLDAYRQVAIASGLWKNTASPEAEGKTASPNPPSPSIGA